MFSQVSTSQPSISTLTPAKTAKVSVTHSLASTFNVNKTWSMSCLRPSPPLRPPLLYREDGMRSPRGGRKLGRRKPGIEILQQFHILGKMRNLKKYCFYNHFHTKKERKFKHIYIFLYLHIQIAVKQFTSYTCLNLVMFGVKYIHAHDNFTERTQSQDEYDKRFKKCKP